mgnify:CR=1 FL=1
MSYFNKNIRYYRKMRRLTQDAFADYLDIKKGKLIAWENKSEPKFDELVRICDLLKVNLLDFITNEITNENAHEFFADKNSALGQFDEPFVNYGRPSVDLNDQNEEELDVFSLIDRLITTNDIGAKRELGANAKTQVGQILLDLANQKDKNIRLLETRGDGGRSRFVVKPQIAPSEDFVDDEDESAEEEED